MTGLAAFRTCLAMVGVPLFLAACGGGSGSTSTLPATGIQAPQQSVAGASVGLPYRAVARRADGLAPAGCKPFPYPAAGLPPPCTVYMGGFISPNHGESPAQQIASTATFEQQIGRPLAMDLHYYQWTDSFPGILEADDLKNGRIPFESWHCGSTDYDVVSGLQDGLIAKRAAAIASYGHLIFLRYKWEMNLTYNPKCADAANDGKVDGAIQYNPTLFIEAWQHIRAVFAANGASNVVWVFNPSSSGAKPEYYYPGDNEVDWIGFDHYDTSFAKFADTFNQNNITHGQRAYHTYPYFFGLYPNKPLVIGETGVGQSYQPTFLNGGDAALQQNFPNIQAFVYWDSTGNRGQYQLLQFGIQAYKQFAAGPYEQGFNHS